MTNPDFKGNIHRAGGMNLPKTKKEFLDTYYLKNELLEICRENNLPKNGSKKNLTKYICDFMENKEIGGHFKYNVPFMKWMNENKGKKTYEEV